MKNIETSNLFTEYLESTLPNIPKPFSTLKWLQSMDQDTLDMLNKYTYNFDDATPIENVNYDEVADFLQLVESLALIEDEICEKNVVTLIQEFIAMIAMEILCRKELASVAGDGLLTGQNTKYKLTKLGEMASDSLNGYGKDG